MIDWVKLKREWKTFALAVATTAVGLWDAVAAYGYHYETLIKEEYRMYVIPAVGIAFLALRKWASPTQIDTTTVTTTTETTLPEEKADVANQ